MSTTSAGPGYEYTNNWFESSARHTWDWLVPRVNPDRILEVGSYEGASACYLIDALAPKKSIEIHCVDTWEGGTEHKPGGSAPANMSEVRRRFHRNTGRAMSRAAHPVGLHCHEGSSGLVLAGLVAQGMGNRFDFIYVDGSHQAPDVLCDAVLGFRLLRTGGVMAFDDYLWSEPLPYGVDPVRCPKAAIDAFTTLYCRKLRILPAPLYQLYIQKTAD